MADELGIMHARAFGDGQRMMVGNSGPSQAISPPVDANMPTPAATPTFTPTFTPSPAPGTIASLAMFVPVHEDLTRPFADAPRSRLDRARATLQAVDAHRAGVRRGLVHLGLLEQQHLLAVAAAAADLGPPHRNDADEERDPDLMGPAEADAMLATMRAPAVPGYDYSVTDAQMAQAIPLEWPPAAGERPGGRREAVRRQQMLVERVLAQLAGYEGHSSAVRAQWAGALEREQKRLQAQFGTADAEAPARDSGSGSGGGLANGTALGIATSLLGIQQNNARRDAASTEPAASLAGATTGTTAAGTLDPGTIYVSANNVPARPPTAQLPANPDQQRSSKRR